MGCLTNTNREPMSAEKAIAIVLRSIDFSETSSIVTLFTREFGKVRGLAKGARRLKGPFESALDLLAVCRIVFLRKSSDALNLVTEAKLERRFRPSEGDLSALYAAYYVAELLDQLTDDFDPHPEAFDAARHALALLAEPGVAAEATLRFELTLLRRLGHLPAWKQCVECGRAVEPAERVAFGFVAGGVLCANCRPGHRGLVATRGETLLLLDAWSLAEENEPLPKPDRALFAEARNLVARYITHMLGHRPRMHRYLKLGD